MCPACLPVCCCRVFLLQVHFFNLQPSGTLYAKLNWRILEPDGEFFER